MIIKSGITHYLSFLLIRIKNFIKVHSLLIKGTKISKPNSIEIRGEIDVGQGVEIDNNVRFTHGPFLPVFPDPKQP